MAEYIDRERLRMHDYCGDTVAWNIWRREKHD